MSKCWSFCLFCKRRDCDMLPSAVRTSDKNDDERKQSLSVDNEGNPRNKVALLPGHSLMDWIRLGNSGADLTGVGGMLKTVTEEQLNLHRHNTNAWLAIRGQVYNIAPYLNFHPGGVEELMKGAGQDATKMFMEVHSWVNYESILKKCLVGRLVKKKSATQEDLSKAFFDVLAPPSAISENASAFSALNQPSEDLPRMRMTWQQTTQSLTICVHTNSSCPHVIVRILPDSTLLILVRVAKKLTKFSFRPLASLKWPCKLSVNPETGQATVQFQKTDNACWDRLGEEEPSNGRETCDNLEIETYFPAKIESIESVNHNCSMLVLQFIEPVAVWIPVGHDIRLKGIVEGVEIVRRYTPTVSPFASSNESASDCLRFLIKHYPDGALTPFIFRKKVMESLEVGGPAGDFDVLNLLNVHCLYLIAAGTGITPMTRLIHWSLARKESMSTIKLLFLNRCEKDIIWRKELDELALSTAAFSVSYGLSEPDETWSQLKGRLDEKLLENFVPLADAEATADSFICVCGPSQFTDMVQQVVKSRGWKGGSHYFTG